MPALTAAAVFAASLLLAACAGSDGPPTITSPVPPLASDEREPAAAGGRRVRKGSDEADRPFSPSARIVTAGRRLQCVAYARRHSDISIRGDAWTWWRAAAGRYERGTRPEVGSVLVFKRKRGSRGHLAVVRRVVGEREIVVDHANWLNRGRIHLDTPVRDESPGNDWSVLRVWYTPGGVWGKSRYRAYGFIYPEFLTAVR